jgi:hypothetical protein
MYVLEIVVAIVSLLFIGTWFFFSIKQIRRKGKRKIYYRVCYQENQTSSPKSFSPVGRVTHPPYGTWIGPAGHSGYGPYTVFSSLNAAEVFRQSRCHKDKIKHFPIYEVYITPSEKDGIWVPSVCRPEFVQAFMTNPNYSYKWHNGWYIQFCPLENLPQGTILADDVMLLRKIPENTL